MSFTGKFYLQYSYGYSYPYILGLVIFSYCAMMTAYQYTDKIHRVHTHSERIISILGSVER